MTICSRGSGLEQSAPVKIIILGFSTRRIAKMSTVDFLLALTATTTTILANIRETLKKEGEEEKVCFLAILKVRRGKERVAKYRNTRSSLFL